MLEAMLAAVTRTNLPTLIPEHPQPFLLAQPQWLRVDEWVRIRSTVQDIEQTVATATTVNPVTARHLAEHIVGLHKRLLDGRIKLTPNLVERTLKGVAVTGQRRRERKARLLLAEQLTHAYDLLERWAA